jgi:hypothetical protein
MNNLERMDEVANVSASANGHSKERRNWGPCDYADTDPCSTVYPVVSSCRKIWASPSFAGSSGTVGLIIRLVHRLAPLIHASSRPTSQQWPCASLAWQFPAPECVTDLLRCVVRDRRTEIDEELPFASRDRGFRRAAYRPLSGDTVSDHQIYRDFLSA